MTPDGDRIEHLCRMIVANVYHCYSGNMDSDYGYLEQLKKQITAGGFASEGTIEELSLTRAIVELRKLAGELELARKILIINTPPKFKVA